MIKIEDIFGDNSWQTLQDSLTKETSLAITTVNYSGEKVNEHSGCHSFCNKVRENKKLGKFCEKCDARGGFEAMRLNEPFIYRCHFNIVDIAIPVVLDKKYIGAIMAGQARVPKEEEESLEKIMTPAENHLIENAREEFKKEYETLPIISHEQLKVVANMLYHLCNYLCSEKQKSLNYIKETLNIETQNYIQKADFMDLDEIDKYTSGSYNSYSEIIKNVLSYIFSDNDNYPSLKEAAKNCHVSSGHLSRIFTKEVGESYTNFISRLKIDRAQSLLENTNKSVAEISNILEYNDAGYLIKVFKKSVGVTPAVYRTMLKKKK